MIEDRPSKVSYDRLVIRKPFLDLFPLSEFSRYEAFVRASGECLKSKPRTRVVLLERSRPGAETPERFIVKEYYYPLLPRLRTWLRHSKAEHEFRSLLKVAELGVHAAEPVAFGTRRTFFGCVRLCFIVTCYVENAVTFEQWAKEARQVGFPKAEFKWFVCQAFGRTFRTLHFARFFLFTAKPRSILVRQTGASPEIVLIDLPYALRIRSPYFARVAQAFDLAVFLANVARILPEYQITKFYTGYLPDPLGGSPEELTCRIADAIRWRRNETPVSAIVHKFRRSGKEFGRWLNCKLKGRGRKEELNRPSFYWIAPAMPFGLFDAVLAAWWRV